MDDALRRLDPATLHEHTADPDAVRAGLAALRAAVRAAELVTDLRRLGEFDDARVEAQRAADRAEIAGTAAQQHLARLRLAQVHQYRGEFPDANVLFTELRAAAAQFGPVIEAFTELGAGSNAFDQRHWDDAEQRFARALALLAPLEVLEAADARTGLAAVARARGGSS